MSITEPNDENDGAIQKHLVVAAGVVGLVAVVVILVLYRQSWSDQVRSKDEAIAAIRSDLDTERGKAVAAAELRGELQAVRAHVKNIEEQAAKSEKDSRARVAQLNRELLNAQNDLSQTKQRNLDLEQAVKARHGANGDAESVERITQALLKALEENTALRTAVKDLLARLASADDRRTTKVEEVIEGADNKRTGKAKVPATDGKQAMAGPLSDETYRMILEYYRQRAMRSIR